MLPLEACVLSGVCLPTGMKLPACLNSKDWLFTIGDGTSVAICNEILKRLHLNYSRLVTFKSMSSKDKGVCVFLE